MISIFTAQGGQVILEDTEISPFCMFHCPEGHEELKEYCDVFNKTIRRYKYLQRHLNEVTSKLIKFLKCFSDVEFTNFARSCGVLLGTGLLSLNALEALFSEHLTKDGGECCGLYWFENMGWQDVWIRSGTSFYCSR